MSQYLAGVYVAETSQLLQNIHRGDDDSSMSVPSLHEQMSYVHDKTVPFTPFCRRPIESKGFCLRTGIDTLKSLPLSSQSSIVQTHSKWH